MTTPTEHRRAAIQRAAGVLRQHMPTAAETRLTEAATDVYNAIVADMRSAFAEEAVRAIDVSIERPGDETVEIRINGEVVASGNHDDHGWSGMDAIEKTALAVTRAATKTIHELGGIA